MVNFKICKKCKESEPLHEFYRHPNMADGHLNVCKQCKREDSIQHRLKNIERIRAYDRERGKLPERIAFNVMSNRLWRKADCRRAAAHNAVSRALKNGTLEKQPCERCGYEKSLAHHEDYDYPLLVMWLCQICHKQRHKEIDEERLAELSLSVVKLPSISS